MSGSGGGGAGATGGAGASSIGGTSGAGVGGVAGAHAGSATAESGSAHGGTSGGGHGGGSGGSAGTGGVAGGSSGSGGATAGASAMCDEIRTDYAAELVPQLECTPGAGSQCADRVAAAPGCECRVFIEPRDPFAIEHLSNVANAWFEDDCSMPSCPAQCTTASAGTCQADSKSSKGGRCVTP